MWYPWLHLLIMLVLILCAAMLFTNALEHLGQKLNISAGVTGSIFAAVGTALPETLIPILAIIAGTSDHLVNEEISVGAILGAPLMLATISTGLMAMSVLKQRGFAGRLRPEKNGFVRDINFFLVALCIAAGAMYVPITSTLLRAGLAAVLVMLYATYLYMTIKASQKLVEAGHGVSAEDTLLITKMGLKESFFGIILQLIAGLVMLVLSAKGFINDIVVTSKLLSLSPLLLSLLIIPIATELPEKVNSIFWVRRGKDTLAFGNITGAMVFQGSLLPAIGLMLTPWQPGKEVSIGICVTLIAALWLRLNAEFGLKIYALLINALLYLIYLYIMLT